MKASQLLLATCYKVKEENKAKTELLDKSLEVRYTGLKKNFDKDYLSNNNDNH